MAGFFRKILNHLGVKKEDEERRNSEKDRGGGRGGGGFSTKRAVPVPAAETGPVVSRCYGNGGIQGLKWYSERLRADDDGDVAQEFLHENSASEFEVKKATRGVKLKGPLCALDGNVHQFVESAGEIHWA